MNQSVLDPVPVLGSFFGLLATGYVLRTYCGRWVIHAMLRVRTSTWKEMRSLGLDLVTRS